MVYPNPGGTVALPVDTKATKAWLAGFGTLIAPLVIQNLLGTSDSAEMIFRYFFCHMLDIACPSGDDVYNAIKTVGGAIVSALGVGYLTYKIPNKAKTTAPVNGGT
jgi:hypothetical protein